MEVDAEITIGGSTFTARQVVKRPDRYSAGERRAAANSINIQHTPSGPFNYSAKLTPLPQTNNVIVEYTQARNVGNAGNAPDLRYNYFLLRDGDWSGGVPPAAFNEGRNLMGGGSLVVLDQFPVASAAYFERGEHTIGYVPRGTTTNDAVCGVLREVNCPRIGGGTYVTPELYCVYDHYSTMLGGNRFVAVTTPSNLCPNAASQAMGERVFMHQFGTGTNNEAIGHEVGHIFSISTANNPTPGHRNNSVGVEGYQVRLMTNRSHIENPSMSTWLMHTTVQPNNTSWVHNADYDTLLNTVVAGGIYSPLFGDYLIVYGRIDVEAGTVFLEPAFRQELPNDPPSDVGECTISLRDASDNVLASEKVTPGVSVHAVGPARHATTPVPETPLLSGPLLSGPQFFSVSLPWHNDADHLRIACGGQTLLTYQRSANAPAVDFTNLSNVDVLSGGETIAWSGSDSNGDDLVYQLQFSYDAGVTFTPLMPLGSGASFALDSAQLPSGDLQMRVIASDGFNTSYAVRDVTAANPLTVLGAAPADGEVAVGVNTTVVAAFVSEVDPDTLQAGGFTMRDAANLPVAGTVSYDAVSRMATFTPVWSLAYNAEYTAILAGTVADQEGNMLGSQVTWSFTTGPDESPPVIWKVSPLPAAPEEPRNALVQVRFREPMNGGSLLGALELFDDNGSPVAGVVTYSALRWSALFTPQELLAANHTYTARLSTAATDLAGNALEAPFEWQFSTGSDPGGPLRIIGNYNDVPLDLDGDGLYNSLNLVVDVEVQVAGDYNLNGRLVDASGRLIGWATNFDEFLTPGVHTLALGYPSALVRSNGEDGPYLLDSLNFYDVEDANTADTASRAYWTFPYDVTDFYAVLAFGGLPDIIVEWNTTLENALNLRDYTFHAERPLSDVSYSIYVNTDPSIGMTIDGGDNLDFAPPPDTEAESDVTILATDPDGNRALGSFHVGVQAPRVSRLTSDAPATMSAGNSVSIEVELLDQWDRLFQESTEVSFSASGGFVTPASMTTSNGRANFSFTAGVTLGPAFITVTAGDATAIFVIQIVDQMNLYVPIVVFR